MHLNSVTGLLFWIPACLAFQQGAWTTGVSNSFLAVTSFAYHQNKNKWLYCLDQTGIALVVLSAANHASRIGSIGYSIHIGSCAYNIIMYWIGYKTNSMAFHPDPFWESIFHATIHCVSTASITSLLLLDR